MLDRQHRILNIDTYFHRMQIYTFPTATKIKRGIWGDSFCIQWLKIPAAAWSLKTKARYFLFNKDANPNPYCILFHETNSDYGHYEPFLYKKLPTLNFEESNDYLSHVSKDVENYWKSIGHEL